MTSAFAMRTCTRCDEELHSTTEAICPRCQREVANLMRLIEGLQKLLPEQESESAIKRSHLEIQKALQSIERR